MKIQQEICINVWIKTYTKSTKSHISSILIFPGQYNDIDMLRDCKIVDRLEQNEKIEADKGYIVECPRFCLYSSNTMAKKV